ncbi:MAG: CRISPR-associated ring nuclease Csm6, partial [Thermodesulfovibrio sp.]|nr:CRISPR-associated ring nuclease Csm6 [Thermodesulfovibrio sp.]
MKNILLCVIGITPQIITETLYALYKNNPPVLIDELFIITTSKGAECIKETIIKENILEQFTKDYAVPKIKFNSENIIVIKSQEGKELSDIRSTKDNESTGNIITDVVRRLTEETDSVLHCSIAGGRKTMGYYLGSALQMYGRAQDKLYHVLVNEQFENNPQFFYPPPLPQNLKIKDKDGKVRTISTDEAKIELAELPFLRLRDFVEFGNITFNDLILNTQKEIDSDFKLPSLKFFYREKTVYIGNQKIQLSPKLWEIYIYFAYQKKKNCINKLKIACNDCYECFTPIKSEGKTKGLLDIF